MPDELSHEMVRLAAAKNSFQAHIWRDALRREGIRCEVLGTYLEGGLGDIPGIAAEVWVDPTEATRAEAILRHHHHL
jgi:hypothetical protein